MKYIGLWEMDNSKIPTDPKESAALMMKFNEMTKQWLNKYPGSEWGIFIGENKGYCSMVGANARDIMLATLAFSPYVKFQTYQAADINEHEEAFKAAMSMIQPK